MPKQKKLLRGMGRIFHRKRRNPRNKNRWIYSQIWWIEYYDRGRQIRKPVPETKEGQAANHAAAVKFLKKQIELSEAGKFRPIEGERLKFSDLMAMVEKDYIRNKRRSLDRAQRAIKHLDGFFDRIRALDVEENAIEQYVDYRLDIDKASNATVKYEMSIAKRAFHLAQKTLGQIPKFPVISVANVRKGFFEEDEFTEFVSKFDEDLQPALKFAYLTGWRMKSEIFSLQWPQVDFTAGEVRLEPGTTKSGDGRTFPFRFVPELEEVLKTQKERTDKFKREHYMIVPWVFHRRGKQIDDIRGAWKKAQEACPNMGKKIPHDFRRSAVRNLERAGVPRSVAMKLVGHKTEEIYRRYAIVAPQDLEDGLKRLAGYRSLLKEEKAKVVQIKPKEEVNA